MCHNVPVMIADLSRVVPARVSKKAAPPEQGRGRLDRWASVD